MVQLGHPAGNALKEAHWQTGLMPVPTLSKPPAAKLPGYFPQVFHLGLAQRPQPFKSLFGQEPVGEVFF